jgi:hypothetical protein
MPQHYAISDSIVGLTEILKDEINLAVWQRRPDTLGASFAGQLVSNGAHLSDNRVVDVSNDQVPDLSDLVQAYSHYAGHAEFVEDVSGLVQAYSFLLGATRIGMRLRVLEKAMCPRFHVDYVSVRLITTYVGVGSEWLEEDKVQRASLLQGGHTDAAPNRLDTGDVALFKGERWSGNEGRGIIHRSPVVDDNQRRLILTLDWLK